MTYLIYFIFTFIICYLISYFLIIRKNTKYSKKKVPVEVEYLIKKYNLNIKNINYKNLLRTVGLVGSFDMALVAVIVINIENIILQLLVGFLVLIPVIIISFRFVGKYYLRKGSNKK